jgi:two-component system response regulator
MPQHATEILLVEDDRDDADITIRALREYKVDHHMEQITDGVQALDFLFSTGAYATRDAGATTLKVIFLDIKLPKVGGLEVLREIKGDVRTRTIPVVVLTSSSQSRDLREAYLLGVNSYIVKPLDLKPYLEAVGTAGLYWLQFNQLPEL